MQLQQMNKASNEAGDKKTYVFGLDRENHRIQCPMSFETRHWNNVMTNVIRDKTLEQTGQTIYNVQCHSR